MIAPLLVWRRAEDDFLLLTEPELGETVRAHLSRMRIAARCEIELEEHTSAIVLGGGEGIPNRDYGVPAVEVLDGECAPSRQTTSSSASASSPAPPVGAVRSTRASCLPRPGSTSGRLVHQGLLPGPGAPGAPPQPRARQPHAACPRHRLRARAQRRRGGPRGPCGRPRDERRPGPRARLPSRRGARPTPSSPWPAVRHGYTDLPAPVAQGIERCPAEAEAASSNLAGRMAPPGRPTLFLAGLEPLSRATRDREGGGVPVSLYLAGVLRATLLR